MSQQQLRTSHKAAATHDETLFQAGVGSSSTWTLNSGCQALTMASSLISTSTTVPRSIE